MRMSASSEFTALGSPWNCSVATCLKAEAEGDGESVGDDVGDRGVDDHFITLVPPMEHLARVGGDGDDASAVALDVELVVRDLVVTIECLLEQLLLLRGHQTRDGNLD